MGWNPGITYTSPMRSVLALFAHPDDETFGPGATLAKLAAGGCRVNLVCATRGESGTIDRSAHIGRRGLGALRIEELNGACSALGIEKPRILNLPDSGLHRLEPETLQLPFTAAIREFRPEIIITFHSDGISGHRDHRTVTRRAREAFDFAADSERWPHLGEPHAAGRLWCYTVAESQASRITFRKLHSTPDAEVEAWIEVGEYLAHKQAAVDAHATQKLFIENMARFLGGLEDWWNPEAFVMEAGRVPISGKVTDLFAGMPAPAAPRPDHEV